MATSTTTQTPRLTRRWYQFSLRALLLAMLISTVGFGGWLHIMRQRAKAHRERVAAVEEVIATIEEAGGNVGRDYDDLRSATWLEKLFENPGNAYDPVRALTITSVKFTEKEARISSMFFNMLTLRAMLQLYKAQHEGLLPSADLSELLKGTNVDGTDGTKFGPYIYSIPVNNMTDVNAVKSITSDPATVDDVTSGGGGWLYNPASGNIWIDHADHYTK